MEYAQMNQITKAIVLLHKHPLYYSKLFVLLAKLIKWGTHSQNFNQVIIQGHVPNGL